MAPAAQTACMPPKTPDPGERVARRLAWHQAVHDPAREPRNRLRWLKALQAWQAARLQRGFAGFLDDPARRPAAEFFLTDMYGDHDFNRRDTDLAKVMPTMQALLPSVLLATVSNGIELGALTHALDLRMAEVLHRLAPRRRKLDDALYARAYREVGHPRLRARQIALIDEVGRGLAAALRTPGVGTLLKVSRLPAKATGLSELQAFLERGFAAFAELGDPAEFLAEIRKNETRAMQRLFAGHPEPFAAD